MFLSSRWIIIYFIFIFFNHLFISVHPHDILFFVVESVQLLFILLLKLFELWPLWALWRLLLCPFNMFCMCCCCCFKLFLTFWLYKMLQAHVVISLPQSWNYSLLQGAQIHLIGKQYLEINFWVLDILIVTEMLMLLGFSDVRGRKCILMY